MGQKNNSVRIPEEVEEFARASFKKFKKKNKDYYDSKKELKLEYYSNLVYDLDYVIEFILEKGYINNEAVKEIKNGCFSKFVGEESEGFIKFLKKILTKRDEYPDYDLNNIKLLPCLLYEIISDINTHNQNLKKENPDGLAEIDPSGLYELSSIILKKKIKKCVKKGIDESVAFDCLSIIPTSSALKYSPFYRVKTLFSILYTHGKDKNIDFEKVISNVVDADYHDIIIQFAIQERKEKYSSFNESQKALFNAITDWVFNTLEDFDKNDIKSILKKYITIRKNDASQGKDGNRRYFIKSLPESVYPNTSKVIAKIIEEDPENEKYL